MNTVDSCKNYDFKRYISDNIVLTDGAFGTYYASVYNTYELPELANIYFPERVKEIHKQYIYSGANLIRTNTYACNTVSLNSNIDNVLTFIKRACELADEAVNEAANAVEHDSLADFKNFIAGDIGPIMCEDMLEQETIEQQYIEICKCFIKCKVPVIIFETFSELEAIKPAIQYIHNNSDIFVIVQFAINQFGYSSCGLSARRLFEEASELDGVGAVGLNCSVGSGHMQQLLSRINVHTDKYITALPNAGYPQNADSGRPFLTDNKEYFSDKVAEIAAMGVKIVGGCCGTTPDYISRLCKKLKKLSVKKRLYYKEKALEDIKVVNNAFYEKKLSSVGRIHLPDDKQTDCSCTVKQAVADKLIAVELAPPLGSDDQKLMEAAHILKRSNVDVLTFPDSPSGRTRVDSILMAEKVRKETGLCVMPHLCCRDKNAIAIRSQLLGAHINDINNFLVVTGDPIPSVMRTSVKAVFNFDAVGLMNIIHDMNLEEFKAAPLCYGGAINQNRRNFDLEIKRVKKKMEAGASFFLTQPVFDEAGADKLRQIKSETKAMILCGIMPFVSLKNAVFMKNEMTGIEVSDKIIERYEKCVTKEDGENVGIEIAKEVIMITKDFVDGYYFSFPFIRVGMLEKIIN